MGIYKRIYLLYILFFLLFPASVPAQVVFKDLPQFQLKTQDSTFFNLTKTRKIVSLNGVWQIYQRDNKNSKLQINVPAEFTGDGDIVFEKTFSLTENDLINNRLILFFFGLNYSADISINNIIIYRHTGGDFPFSLELPRDILNIKNVISVKLNYKLDSENTIPVKQRFMFPKSFGGILRDVFIYFMPNISISDFHADYKYNSGTKKASIKLISQIDNKVFRNSLDTLTASYDLILKTSFIKPDGTIESSSEEKFNLPINSQKNILDEIQINSPVTWSPLNPESYLVMQELYKKDSLIDISKKSVGIYSLTVNNKSLLNGKEFYFNGVTYLPSFDDRGGLSSYDQMEKDITIIKNLGFNSVRFSKSTLHPYYLRLCEKYGLFAFIEIPINSIPGGLSSDPNFAARCENYLSGFLKAYKNYSAVAAIGVGSSYLPDLDKNISLIEKLAAELKSNSSKLTYSSFINYNITPIQNIDLYGIEFFNSSIENEFEKLNELQEKIGKAKVFISEATYTVNSGKSDGYVNKYSYEAQAKFFDDLINASQKDSISYFINSMFDYRGDYASIISGYNENNIYHIGIAGEDRSTDRLGYNVIASKFHNTEKVTIPIGSKKDDAPMSFIIYGILLALIVGILVNSGRKFREDASRALLRPYNFYADVRDQRIISGFHSIILAAVISAIMGLIAANLLYFFRTSVEFEKILLSFGNFGIMKAASYLAWHPLASILWLSVFFFIFLFIITVAIKIASFFVRNIVYYSSIYFSVSWSFLPFVLLIPVGIILYRVLNIEVVNFYIYLLLILFMLWVFYRLMKGIYVIFDVNPGSVYFYSIIIVLLFVAAFAIFFEIKNSFVDYFLLTLKQF